MTHRAITAILVASVLLLIAAAGCIATTDEKNEPVAPADEAYARGLAEYGAGNYRVAEERFAEAYALYTGAGDADKALTARNAIFRTNRTVSDARSTVAPQAALEVPGSPMRRSRWRTLAPRRSSRRTRRSTTSTSLATTSTRTPTDAEADRECVDFDYIGRYAWGGKSGARAVVNGPLRGRRQLGSGKPVDRNPEDLVPAPGRDGRAEERHRHEPLGSRLHRRRPVHHRGYRLRLLRGPGRRSQRGPRHHGGYRVHLLRADLRGYRSGTGRGVQHERS